MEWHKTSGSTSEQIISFPKEKREFEASLFGLTVRNGFKKLHKDERTSDIILLVGEERLPAHRVVLCAWSETFRGMLETGSWQESNEKELRINIEEEDYPNFKFLIEYMYTGNVNFVDDDNVLSLISLTNYYGIHSLKEVCGKLLGELINDSNIQVLLDLVDKYDCKELEKKCGEYLASNFQDMWEDDQANLLSLRPDTWVAMLQSDDLAITSEQHLFEMMQQYVNVMATDEESRTNLLDRLLPHIRYCSISPKYLTEVLRKDKALMSHPMMKEILLEALSHLVNRKCLPSLFNQTHRGGYQQFDERHKTSHVTLTEDNTKATTSSSEYYGNARVMQPFSDRYIYCAFTCDAASDNMIGAIVGDLVVGTESYIGEDPNGYCLHGSDGSLYHSAGQYQSTGATWGGSDVIGISYIRSTGKLYWYRNGVQIASLSIQANGDVYAAVSIMEPNGTMQPVGVSLVPHPSIPDDLREYLPGNQHRKNKKRAKKDE